MTDSSERYDVALPNGVTEQGRPQDPDHDLLVEQMMTQLLMTSPGERVNRPSFGVGLPGRIFVEATDPAVFALQADIIAAVQQWLPEVARADAVSVHIHDSTTTIEVTYEVLRTGSSRTATIQVP